ncbi:MAG: DNA primase [Desulfobulbaceae bacterium]|nr:DNA primase [Desulfobulbaceae bacterium]
MTADNMREEIKNRVREAADIVQVIGDIVELKKAGSRYSGLCPFHAEKTPSFSVNPQGQFFHCFGCGESGDVFSFVMKYNRLSFPEALKELAGRYHIDLPEPKLSDADRERIRQRDLLYSVNKEAAQIYQEFLATSADAEDARRYLETRGVPEEIIRVFKIGYAPEPASAGWSYVTARLQNMNLSVAAIERAGLAVKKDRGGYYDRFRDRILFPIMDMSGQVVAFGGRILGEGQPKYMNSPESPIFDKSRLLFGLFQHREKIRECRQVIVVEGNFDLILLAVHGIENVVAPLGTALTREHIRSLRGYCDEVVLLFDGDSAGLKAAMRSVPFFLAEHVDARVAVLPDGHDPDSYVREKGPDAIAKLVDEASPLAEFVFETLSRRYGLTLDGKNKIVSELQEIISAGDDSVQRSLMTAHFSEMLGISPAQFEGRLPHSAGKNPQAKVFPRASLKNLPRKERQLLNFLILYPEYFPELMAAGIERVIADSAVKNIFQVLDGLAEAGWLTPDRLLVGLPEGSAERQYVAELLILGNQEDNGENEQHVRQMCDEMLSWLHMEQNRKDGASLQEQIQQAQLSGDEALLMDLLAEKQNMAKKK